jgi:hypothetical protein
MYLTKFEGELKPPEGGDDSELGQADGLAERRGFAKHVRDMIPHSYEEANRLLALNNFFRIVDNYERAQLHFRYGITGVNGENYDLVCAVKVSGDGHKFPNGGLPFRKGEHCARANAGGDQPRVLLDVSHVVHGPKGIIPSLVWLVPFEEREDFRRNSLVLFEASYRVGEFGSGASERVCGPFFASGMFVSNSVGHLIQTGSHVVDCIKDDAGHFLKNRSVKLRFEEVFSKIRIELNNKGVWLTGLEGLDSEFQVCDMLVCATENGPRAGE